ncbi:MAG: hypothetical protein JXX28_10470 [Deltaproteobacteria bacterium]|nr:hypothetical protein [Deltaproteobacteria bacterium]
MTLLLFALAAVGKDGGGLPVTVTEELKIRYWTLDQRLPSHPDQPVFNYVEEVNRLSVHGQGGGWQVWAQVDEVALGANRYYLDDVLYVERELVDPSTTSWLPRSSWANLEKVALRRDTGWGQIHLGDFYAAFGRGVSLNLNRNVDIDVDTSIQGVKAVAHPGAWDLTAVAGQLNRQQVVLDNPNLGISGDLRHSVVGLRAERFGLGVTNVGAHAVAWQFVDEQGLAEGLAALGGPPDAVIGGLTVEAQGLLGLDWYAEADHFSYPTNTLFGGEASEPGYALYGSAAAYWGSTVWLLEAKDYQNAERVNSTLGRELYEVAVAPTLEYERSTSEDSAAALNSNDLVGARLRVDWSARDGLIPYASLGLFRDEELGGLHFNRTPETIVHGLTGLELIQGHWAVLLNAGVRVDRRDQGEADYGADRQVHGDLDLKFPLGHGYLGNISAGMEHFSWGVNPLQQSDYFEMENAFSIQKGSDVALIAYLDRTTNPLVDTTGNLSDDLYGALELQVKPSSALTAKVFYGAYKAGIRCSGGQCRTLPGFDGARVSLVASF